MHARESILLTNYYQVVQIEAKTMAYMLRKQILPAIFSYEAKLAQIIQTKKSSGIEAPLEVKILKNINRNSIYPYGEKVKCKYLL